MLPFCFVTNSGTATGGRGLFQNILRSVPEKQREVELEMPTSGLGSGAACPCPPAHPPGAAWGLRGSRQLVPQPQVAPRPESLRRGTGQEQQGAGSCRGGDGFSSGEDRTRQCFVLCRRRGGRRQRCLGPTHCTWPHGGGPWLLHSGVINEYKRNNSKIQPSLPGPGHPLSSAGVPGTEGRWPSGVCRVVGAGSWVATFLVTGPVQGQSGLGVPSCSASFPEGSSLCHVSERIEPLPPSTPLVVELVVGKRGPRVLAPLKGPGHRRDLRCPS